MASRSASVNLPTCTGKQDAMDCQLLCCLLFVLLSSAKLQVIDVDCVTADGSVGRCMESSQCSTYHQVTTVLCRYSRGYGMRICCPRSSIRDLPLYGDSGPLAFPGDSAGGHGYNSYQTTNSYRPNIPHNKPQYHEKPSYASQPSYNERPEYSGSSFERPNYSSSSGGYDERPGGSSGYERPTYTNGNDKRPNYSGGSSGFERPSYSSGYNGRPNYSSNSNEYQNKPNYSSGSFGNQPSYSSNSNGYQGNSNYPSSNGYQEPNYSQGSSGSRKPDRNRPQPGSNVNTRETTTTWEFPSDDRRTTPRPNWALENNYGGSSTGSRRRISELKCEEYSQPVSQTINALPLSINAEAVPLRVQNCDFSAVKLIVGGEASELGEFPHMAAVGYRVRMSRDIMWNCGGTLISERYVLTAGHCANTSFGNPVMVRLGEYNIERDNDGADPQDYGIQQVIIHPSYYKTLKYNDIALLRLDRDVRFNKYIRPACLPTDNVIRGRLVATGWGRTDFVGRQSDILMKVALNVIDNRQCNTYYNTNNPGSSSFASGIVDTMLCAGYVEGGRDTCLGDSGGPLTITKKENPCIHYIVGITSFGKICAAPKSPGVYTRVIKYLDWIEKTIWP